MAHTTHIFQNTEYVGVCHGPDTSRVREKASGIVLDSVQKRPQQTKAEDTIRGL